MRIDNENSLAFKTNIRIVSPNRYRRIIEELQTKGPLGEIAVYDIVTNVKNPICKAFATKIENVYTKHIRSCTGVLVADKGNEASLFGHFYNSAENIRDSKLLEKYMQGTNAVLIGSKWQFDYSADVFNTFKNKIRKRKIPMTIMKNLSLDYEANMAYTANNDELILCVKNAFNPKVYVQNMKDLKKVFRRVKISSADSIQFDTRPKPTFWDKFREMFKQK